MAPPENHTKLKPRNNNSKRKSKGFKKGQAIPQPEVLSKKRRFRELMEKQKEIEASKKQKRMEIEAKRKAREEKRNRRNKAWQKLTKKGQPIMKERINFMLKQLEDMQK